MSYDFLLALKSMLYRLGEELLEALSCGCKVACKWLTCHGHLYVKRPLPRRRGGGGIAGREEEGELRVDGGDGVGPAALLVALRHGLGNNAHPGEREGAEVVPVVAPDALVPRLAALVAEEVVRVLHLLELGLGGLQLLRALPLRAHVRVVEPGELAVLALDRGGVGDRARDAILEQGHGGAAGHAGAALGRGAVKEGQHVPLEGCVRLDPVLEGRRGERLRAHVSVDPIHESYLN